MSKNKLCPMKKHCKSECYGENICAFAKKFDYISHKLDLKLTCIESLREERDQLNAQLPAHGHWIDNGAYVTTAYGSLPVKTCSHCFADVTLDDYEDFCPNCGTIMDEVK